MEVLQTIEEIRETVEAFRREGKRVGFVPTMGALHEGHLSLFQLARKHADKLVVSIYVNPEQFGPGEDFDAYPRRLEQDQARCEAEGVDAVFIPSDEIMYPERSYIKIKIEELNQYMDGSSRPGFFEGIVTVVNKLFNIVKPDIAAFGQKDIQQFRILQHMVQEFNHDVELLMGPIKRADDGLALSSRNAYLDSKQREIAPGLYRSLAWLQKQVRDGAKNTDLLFSHQRSELEAKGFKIDYLGLFSYASLKPAGRLEPGSTYILAGAAYLGETRLIDNIIFKL